jgi:hypothetical protein
MNWITGIQLAQKNLKRRYPVNLRALIRKLVNFIYNKLSESHENSLQLLNKTRLEKFKL